MENTNKPQLKEQIATLPTQPGVYMFKDIRKRILYVGKANNLRSRVASYLSVRQLSPSKQTMMQHARTVDVMVVRNEQEALTLEASLIRRRKPPYNVRFVDDSSYYYIKITNDPYPTVQLVRSVLPDGAWYRGPFPSSGAVRATLKTARKFFPWCQYSDPSKSKQKPCFAYHIHLCPGICVGNITQEEYQQHMKRLAQFLDGKTQDVLTQLQQQMNELSTQEKYEQAAVIRDRIHAIERTMTPQSAVAIRNESADVIGIATRNTQSIVAVTRVREGCITGTNVFRLAHPSLEPKEHIVREFLIQYVERSPSSIPHILLPFTVHDINKNISVSVPQRGWKRSLLTIANANAETALSRNLAELDTPVNLNKALTELAHAIGLSNLPKRIEAYDISNIQGTLATASLVVFENGKPKKSQYRKFKISANERQDDTHMMEEVLRRRFTKASDTTLPDLIILDGGKGQLNVGIHVLREANLVIPITALAKREEELFVAGKESPIIFPPTSPALYLIQRIRDEAHRFTLSYHKLLRKKHMTRSALEEIPGVGPITRKRLIRTFGSVAAVRSASQEELASVVGIKKANVIKETLNDQ